MPGLRSSSVDTGEVRVSVQSGETDYRDASGIERLVQSALEELRLEATFVRPGDRVVRSGLDRVSRRRHGLASGGQRTRLDGPS